MKLKNRKSLLSIVTILLLNNLPPVTAFAQQRVRTAYESYYLRSRNFPSFDNLWTLNGLSDGEGQGVAHDDNNWFFTWAYNNVGYLIKIPVEVQIDNDVLSNPKVSSINMTQFRDLTGYWHWGDPDRYNFNGTDYIVVPITGDGPPIIAIFRAKNLSIVAYGKLKQVSTGWCAVNPKTGELFTSEDFDYASGSNSCNTKKDCDDQSYHCLYARTLLRYSIPWNTFPASGYIGQIAITPTTAPPIDLLAANGRLIELYNMQGGEFSPSGELLYICSGSGCCESNGPGQEYEFDGINAFDTQTWRTSARSSNHSGRFPLTTPPKYFDFYYPLGCDGAGSWSPEGFTIWSLGGRAPGINGQLHVLLYKYRATGDNRQVFEHFTNGIYVDPVNGLDQPIATNPGDDDEVPGGPLAPFKTFKFAYNGYPAWDGSVIVLEGGRYSATGKYTTRIRITSERAPAMLR